MNGAINAAGDAAIALWQTLFWVLVHGTVLAAIAWALSVTLLRNARPAVVAALWSVVLIKFVLPVGPALPWSLSSALDGLLGGGAAAAPPPPPAAAVALPASAVTPSIDPLGAVALLAAAAWLAIAAVLIGRRIAEHRALRRRVAAAPLAPVAISGLVEEVAARLGLRRPPAVRIDHAGDVPWVIGLGRPVLMLPHALVDGAARRDELAAVIGHELAHLRRRDGWLRLVQVIAGALFFFWPVVRWASRRADAARELACDAWAIARGPLPPQAYARVLVRLVRCAHDRGAPAAALALAARHGAGHGHLLGRRVDALLGDRRGRPLRAGVGAPGAALLAGWVVLSLGGAARADAPIAAVDPECRFSPELAAEILLAHPEADADGDGELTRREACEFQLELDRASETEPPLEESPLAGDALCCNCGATGDTSASAPAAFGPPDTCTQD